jgi:hypothetical protein
MEKRGWPEARIAKVMGGNWLQLLKDVWKVVAGVGWVSAGNTAMKDSNIRSARNQRTRGVDNVGFRADRRRAISGRIARANPT